LSQITDNEYQDVNLPKASHQVYPHYPSHSESLPQPRVVSSSHSACLDSNKTTSFPTLSSNGTQLKSNSPQIQAIRFSNAPALPSTDPNSPSSSNHSKVVSRASSSSTHPQSGPPSPAWSKLNITTKKIRKEVERTYIHQNDNPDREFVAAGTAEKVLCTERLTDLFMDELGPQRTGNLIAVVQRLSLRPVILVLVQMICDQDILLLLLLQFEDYYVKSGKDTPRELPFTLKQACDIFGAESGNTFFRTQSRYTPVIVEEDRHTIIGNSMRLPIFCGRELGKGGYGTVFETRVPKGVWRSSSTGSTNVDEMYVASKVFNDKEVFDAEVAIYKTIEQDGTHKNLTKYLGSLQYDTGQGTKHVIFLPQAICNLDAFLTDPTRVGQNQDFGTKNILQYAAATLRDAAGLVCGLKHLHEALTDENGQDISVLHGDIKPQNILVFGDGQGQGRYIWKLADYGLSKTKSRERGRDDTSSPSRNGTFISPEAHSGSKVTIVSDLWSLAAVLIVVITHIVDGPEGKDSLVKKFHITRQVEDSNDRHDRFFEGSGDNACVNTRVTEWCDKLRKIAAEKGENFGQIISEILDFLENNLLVLDVEKRRKTQAGKVREHLLSMAQRLEGRTIPSAPSANPGQPAVSRFARMKERLRKLARRMNKKWRKASPQLATVVRMESRNRNEA
jgi:serine/threonine protein kinase